MNPKELRAKGATYKIIGVAGSGLTASVYKAVRSDDEGHSEQIVALKVLKDPRTVHWLKREFETLIRIQSDACVKVLTWENFPDGPALVLEWIDGVSLFELARAGRLEPRWADDVIAQAQEGLRALDEQGLHHGDLSPANILVDQTGRVRLIDFTAGQTEEKSRYGTPAYLAPELWQGSATNLFSDLFALGVIETDIRSRFSEVPTNPEHMRDRSFRFSQDVENPLLARDPSERRFSPASSSAAVRSEMAQAVSDVKALRMIPGARTQAFESLPSRSRFPYRFALSYWFILFLAVAPVGAQAPPVANLGERATISVASHRWAELRINGKDVGYAPLEIPHLMPGSHRVQWKTARGAGEFRVHLEPGQYLRLADEVFTP